MPKQKAPLEQHRKRERERERERENMRPHVLVFPYPVQGHIMPAMHFSQKLAARGIMVTFVTIATRLANIRHAAAADGHLRQMEEEGDIRLAGLDDGLPADDPRNPVDMVFVRAIEGLGGALKQLLTSISGDEELPPATCIVSDSFLPWTVDLALQWGIPRVLFWTMSFATCCAYTSTSKLIRNGYDPFAKRVKHRGERPAVTLTPGLSAMDPYDLPFNSDSDFVEEESENTKWLRSIVGHQFDRTHEAAWFIGNSFHALEGAFIDALCSSSVIPQSKLLLLGPLCEGSNPEFRASLWKEEELDCLQWLDSQKDSSVLYISFGSVVLRAGDATMIILKALAACRQPFLWALRCGWEEVQANLSGELLQFVTEKGKLTTWTPQLKVLSHRAVGGFFSHAGWNSTVESISKGVPMLAWPCFLDQFSNSWEVSCLWKTGVQLMMGGGDGDGDGQKQTEKAIRALMQSEQRELFRRRASELQAASMASSAAHLDLFVKDMFMRVGKSGQE